jgi:hypothetical protein
VRKYFLVCIFATAGPPPSLGGSKFRPSRPAALGLKRSLPHTNQGCRRGSLNVRFTPKATGLPGADIATMKRQQI